MKSCRQSFLIILPLAAQPVRRPGGKPAVVVRQSFCLWLRTSFSPCRPCLISSPGQRISLNRQASHLIGPQCASRVVKVRQASQKNAPSSLDVKPTFLPPRHSQSEEAPKLSTRLKTTASQIIQPQPPLRLVKVRKAFAAPLLLSLPV